MKEIVGLIMIIAGIALGLYVGLWLCFVGGIVQIINAIKSPEAVMAMNIVVGILRIVIASVAGWASATFLIAPGYVLLSR